MTAILSWLASLLSGPIVRSVLDGYKAKLDAGNTTERVVAELAARELDVQAREIEAGRQLRIAQVGHWATPESLFGYIMVIYFAKIVLWDKVLALGSTDPITGAAADWAGWIMIFYFGKRGVENVARIMAGVLRK
jgi:hypothetical protein